MGLETTTFISGLNTSWPLAGDPKSQGDDHIRLLKGVLTATFPTASKAFYMPSWEASTVAMVLDATDQNNLIALDVTSGDLTVSLPTTLTSSDKGWSCEIYKSAGATTNGIMVSAASAIAISNGGSVASVATVRIERYYEPVRFVWTGSAFFAVKPGMPVGSSLNWDAVAIPAGYRIADGTTYSSTTFAELNAAYGTTTLKDKRGRVEAGVDGGQGRLTTTYFGVNPVLGTVGGAQYNVLDGTTLPVHYHGATISDPSHNHGHNAITGSTTTGGGGFPAGSNSAATIVAATTGISITSPNGGSTTYSAGGGAAHANVQPTIITQKLIRVC